MPIIQVEKLGKKYDISHQRSEPYGTLRDILAERVKAVGTRVLHPFGRRPPIPGSSMEEFWALKDVSFEINQGDRVGIIGRNGAGKSTLLKILSRIVEPTTGMVRIKGRVASLLEVGTGFHPELTGRENIFLNGAILGMSRAEIRRKFDEIVAFAEVERFLDTPVKRYSSGMYVRLAFAVAAHLEPEILVVDEVLAVGDAQFQKKCLGKMEQVGKEGRTILFVSHDMTAVKALCNQVIILDGGQIVGQGDVDDQISSYLQFHAKVNKSGLIEDYLLGTRLILKKLELVPNPVEVGSDLKFSVCLQALAITSIQAITIVFYDVIGIRVAIIDLRVASGPYIIEENKFLNIVGKITDISFVEGDYRVSFYVDYGEIRQEYLDLLNLSVTEKPIQTAFAPYPPRVSGYLKLKSEFNYFISE